MHVLQDEARIGFGSSGEGGVQLQREARRAAGGDRVQIAEQRGGRQLEVVLDDLRRKMLLDGLPDMAEARELGVDCAAHIGGGSPDLRRLAQVEARSVQIDDVGRKGDERRRIEDGILIEAAVFGLVKRRLEAGGEKEDLQQLDEFVGGGTAEDGDAHRLQAFRGGELAAQASAAKQKIVERELVYIHNNRVHSSMIHSGRLEPSLVYRYSRGPLRFDVAGSGINRGSHREGARER